jgi:hypothetical protein
MHQNNPEVFFQKRCVSAIFLGGNLTVQLLGGISKTLAAVLQYESIHVEVEIDRACNHK